ncbi:MAG: carbamoyltransferase HypF [Solirubrobacteraceae bacterium]|jgi:hydrogenase maturation protein HypF
MTTITGTRVRARVDGVVQGVGFRPFVHRLAHEHALTGWVRNDERGVLLEVEGEQAAVERFLERLGGEPPPLASVEQVSTERMPPTGLEGFRILESTTGAPAALVSPDVAPCADCLAELFDASDRRHRYPFINCTNCGPRFTIIRGVPYDRARTTMADFEMCGACGAEYEDPTSRRFHAQPNACPACGPVLTLIDCPDRALAGEQESDDAAHVSERAPVGEDALAGAVAALAAGRTVAVKGLGGYHLACRAEDEQAVAELRARKRREEKPFALMAANLGAVETLVHLGPAERRLLSGPERPIVIARRCAGARVADAVAPGSPDLGVMLPSTPLHHLLLADTGTTLVMTSGNASDEPIAYRDEEALARLGAIADAVLLHDRPIHVRVDDSIVRSLGTAGERPLMLRRSRGYAPRSLTLPLPAPPLLACGAELKSTFCVASRSRAWVSHHIGDLRNWETLRSFREGIEHFEALFAVEPEMVAHDLHPDYLSTAYALQREDVALIGVQHHHAHLAAVLAEHGERGRAIGAIYDGAGLGSDGTVWGGELLLGDLAHAQRVGHLHPVRLPGGDAAVREPWRMACAWLLAAFDGEAQLPKSMVGRVELERWEQVSDIARRGASSPVTTSVGRLFDAVAALCGIRMTVRDEGRAAVELEAAAVAAGDTVARAGEPDAYQLPLVEGELLQLDARETVRAIVDDLADGVSPGVVSARFHNGLADATARALASLAQREAVPTVVLSGGVFQNRVLLERCVAGLADTGLRVLVPRKLPPNDGAISYGQAAVAAAQLAA